MAKCYACGRTFKNLSLIEKPLCPKCLKDLEDSLKRRSLLTKGEEAKMLNPDLKV